MWFTTVTDFCHYIVALLGTGIIYILSPRFYTKFCNALYFSWWYTIPARTIFCSVAILLFTLNKITDSPKLVLNCRVSVRFVVSLSYDCVRSLSFSTYISKYKSNITKSQNPRNVSSRQPPLPPPPPPKFQMSNVKEKIILLNFLLGSWLYTFLQRFDKFWRWQMRTNGTNF